MSKLTKNQKIAYAKVEDKAYKLSEAAALLKGGVGGKGQRGSGVAEGRGGRGEERELRHGAGSASPFCRPPDVSICVRSLGQTPERKSEIKLN